MEMLRTTTWISAALVSVCLAIVPASRAGAQTGLVGYWPLDEGTGRAADDLSGYGNTGYIHGEAVWEETERGKALRFNGKDTTVQTPDHPAWNIGRGEMTVTLWVKCEPGQNGAILEREFGGSPGAWQLTAGGGRPYWSFYDDKTQPRDIRFEGCAAGKWQHLALVWKRDADGWMRTYVNGKPAQFQEKAPCVAKRFADLFIGSMRAAYDYFQGSIREVAIFNRVLTDDEIARIHKEGVRLPDELVVSSVSVGKRRDDPAETATAEVRVRNLSDAPQTADLVLFLCHRREYEREVFRKRLELAPHTSAVQEARFGFKGEDGCELAARLEQDGKTVDLASRVFSASDQLWKVYAPMDPSGFSFPAGRRQLFLDDYGIARIKNLKGTMHPPVKKGAVIKPDRPWETRLETWSAPAWDEREKRFKLWMITGILFPGEGGTESSGTTYAESQDGLHWTKPILRQWDLKGSRDNNFVTIESDPKLASPANLLYNVVYDPDDPNPARRYKALAHANGREPLISADGIAWKRLAVPKIPCGDVSGLSYDRETHTFIFTAKGGGSRDRGCGILTSQDFEHWPATYVGDFGVKGAVDQQHAVEVIKARLANPSLRQPTYNNPSDYHCDTYCMGLFRYEGLYIGLPAVFYQTATVPEGGIAVGNQDGFHHVQLVCSRDLVHWQRLGDRQAFIGPSPVGPEVYDTTQIMPPSFPVFRGDELWFYYGGLKYREPPRDAPQVNAPGAICLAVLRRDGFVSLDAGEQPGTLLTRPFALPGGKLFVNVDAPKGELKIEALNGEGKVAATSTPLAGDLLRGQVRWEKGRIADLNGRQVSLRFTLRNGSFYSYWVEE